MLDSWPLPHGRPPKGMRRRPGLGLPSEGGLGWTRRPICWLHSKHHALPSGRPRERTVAFEVLFAEMQRGEGHAVLASKANDQSTGALGFLVWPDISPENNHEVHVAIGTGLTAGLRAVDNEPFETIAVDFFKGRLCVCERLLDRGGEGRESAMGKQEVGRTIACIRTCAVSRRSRFDRSQIKASVIARELIPTRKAESCPLSGVLSSVNEVVSGGAASVEGGLLVLQ